MPPLADLNRPLYDALTACDAEAVRRALVGVDPNDLAALSTRSLSFLCALLAADGDDDDETEEYALDKERADPAACCVALLQAGASPHGPPGDSPLVYAVRGDYPQVVNLLLEAGADVNARQLFNGNITVLHISALYGKTGSVAALLAAGAAVDARTSNGKTPLALAIPKGEAYHVIHTKLLRAGATLPESIDVIIDDEPVAIPYLEKIQLAGGFRRYETQVTKSLARIFIPKFSKLPTEVIPTIVQFWAHVGDY